MSSTVVLVGAGGKMGCRITDNMKKQSDYRVLHVETGPAGVKNLAERGVAVVAAADALPQADYVVLAVPDNRVEPISAEVVPQMRPGACLVHLDPAAPCAGRVFARADVSSFVTHPCHPPVFNDETDVAAKRDFFGGVRARQNLVCALVRGTEADYERGVALCRAMFAPVVEAYRVSVEQMAILEPALVETVSAPAVMMIREALEEAVRRGVPRDAARAFLMGHVNIQLAITFGEIDARYSDGALKMLAEAQSVPSSPTGRRSSSLRPCARSSSRSSSRRRRSRRHERKRHEARQRGRAPRARARRGRSGCWCSPRARRSRRWRSRREAAARSRRRPRSASRSRRCRPSTGSPAATPSRPS